MDTDILFLTPVETIWNYFNSMNSSQMAALAPEHEDPNAGWYNRFSKHPYYGKLGNKNKYNLSLFETIYYILKRVPSFVLLS